MITDEDLTDLDKGLIRVSIILSAITIVIAIPIEGASLAI
ncbi:hypothetical protein SAMN04488168_13645 [Bacillus sp. 491mf]|nr:hypothetical protein SAMN04488168_13645 [Bacillus sp. 491mf]